MLNYTHKFTACRIVVIQIATGLIFGAKSCKQALLLLDALVFLTGVSGSPDLEQNKTAERLLRTPQLSKWRHCRRGHTTFRISTVPNTESMLG